MSGLALTDGIVERPSPFAGVAVCTEAGFRLRSPRSGPVFEDDSWDFSDVIGLPVQMAPHLRRLGFAAIANPAWRTVAKELMLALLAPRHPEVAVLARASRTPMHLRTCCGRLAELTSWLNWLSAQGVTELGEVGDHHCQE